MTKNELSNAQAVVQRGDTPVVVNTETARVEAEARALATGDQQLELVTLADGRVASVNKTTGQVVLLGTDFRDQGEVRPSEAAGGKRTEAPLVVAAASAAFVLYPDSDVVVQLGDDTSTRAPVRVPGATEVAVGDGKDGLWLLTDDAGKAEVVQVVGDRVQRTVATPTPVRHLTLADGRPIGITEAGQALDLAAAQPKAVNREPVPSGPNVLVPSAKGAGRYLVVLDRTGRLVVVDPRTGKRREFDDLPRGSGHVLGAPVVLDDVVYVPDHRTHELLAFDVGTGERAASIKVPGKSETFALDVQQRRVVANDAKDRATLAITPEGERTLIDKGEGSGVETDTAGLGPPKSPVPRPTTTTTTAPPSAPPPPRTTSPNPSPTPPSDDPVTRVVVPVIPPGTPREDACATLEDSGLRCQAVDIGAGGTPGTVRDTRPPGGARVAENTIVDLHVWGGLTVPDVRNRRIDDACATVNTVLSQDGADICDRQPMPDPGAGFGAIGLVAQQDPGAGSTAAKGSRVTLRHWEFVLMPDLVNPPGQVGTGFCNAVIAQTGGLIACRVQQGSPGPAPGTVQSTSPAAGTGVHIGQEIVVTVFGEPIPKKPVPRVVMMTRENACAAVTSSGFVCDARPDGVHRDAVVATQEPAPETMLDPGQTVIVHYSPYQAVKLWLWKKGDVHVVRLDGDVPANDYVMDSTPLGYAYPLGGDTSPPDGGYAGSFRDFMCDSGVRNCGGFLPNHYYSRDQNPKTGWKVQRTVGLLINRVGSQCPYPGQHQISRYMSNDNNTLRYTVDRSDTRDWVYQEYLGCVWDYP
ncbi:hypothetical protein [Saccharothrix variisporea]|nr:hypothetical protein [Saccharothrix variisporea]